MTGIDWEGLKRIAFGPLNLMPDQFWRLTMGEFMDLVEGYKWRNQNEWVKIAQLAVWTSQKLKKNTTAKKLLGLDKKKEKKKTTAAETKEALTDLTRQFGGKLGVE